MRGVLRSPKTKGDENEKFDLPVMIIDHEAGR